MKKQRPLVPGFLKRFDSWLLLNKPEIWSARTHLVFWYSLLFSIVLAIICFLAPQDFRRSSEVGTWTFFTGLLSFIGIIIWLIFLLRFNVFKKFGLLKRGDRLQVFLLYLLSVAFIAAPVFIPSVVETKRAQNVFSNGQIVTDVNRINLAICRLNYDSLPRNWLPEKCIVRNVDSTIGEDAVIAEAAEMVPAETRKMNIIDSATFRRRKENADSVTRIDDSTYIFYECRDYVFASVPNLYSDYYDRDYNVVVYKGSIQSKALYESALRTRPVFDRPAEEAELNRLLKKYDPFFGVRSRKPIVTEINGEEKVTFEVPTMKKNYTEAVAYNYNIASLNDALWSVSNKINRWSDKTLGAVLRIYWYCILVVTLLLFMFRHSTIRTFFLSMLALVIITVVASLIGTFFQFSSVSGYVMMLVIFLSLLALAVLIPWQRVRRVIVGIGLNLTVLFVGFVPLTAVALFFAVLSSRGITDGDSAEAKYWRNMESIFYPVAEIAGIVLLLILIPTLFARLYRKWYALPEQ